MVQVPRYDAPTVSPTGGLSVSVSPDAFGAQVGKATEQLGGQVERASNVIATHALKMQELHNRAQADEAMANYVIQQSELDSKHRSLEGKARADNFQTYIEQSKALRERFAAGMGNQEARRMFDNETRRYFAYSVRNEAYGVGTELKKYNTRSNQLVVDTAQTQVMGSPDDDNVFEDAVRQTKRGVGQQAENHGWTPEERKIKEEEAMSNLVQARIAAAAQADPVKAQKLYEQNKDKLTPQDRITVENKILNGKQAAGSRAGVIGEQVEKTVKADLQSILETGTPVEGLTFDQVRAARGREYAVEWEQARVDAQIVWKNTHDLPNISLDEMTRRAEKLLPAPGTADYPRQQERFKLYQRMRQEQINLREKDPALAVSKDPAVKAVLSQFGNDPMAKQVLGDARIAAQKRAGISEGMLSPITNDEAQAMMPKPVLPGTERQVYGKVIEQIKKDHGANWQAAVRTFARANNLKKADLETIGFLLRGSGSTPPPAEETRRIDWDEEVGAAEQAVQNLDDVMTPSRSAFSPGLFDTGPVPIKPTAPKKKEPLSKRILEGR